MTIAVDASVVGPLLFVERHTQNALALFADVTARAEPMIAPHLIGVEVTNIIRKQMRSAGLTLDDASSRLEAFLTLPIERLELEGLHHRAPALTEAPSGSRRK